MNKDILIEMSDKTDKFLKEWYKVRITPEYEKTFIRENLRFGYEVGKVEYHNDAYFDHDDVEKTYRHYYVDANTNNNVINDMDSDLFYDLQWDKIGGYLNEDVKEEYIRFEIHETWRYGGWAVEVEKIRLNDLISILRRVKIEKLRSKLTAKEVNDVV